MSSYFYYYNQRNYGHIPYPSPSLPHATLASGGCGPVCASMLVENLNLGKLPPPDAAKLAISSGARVSGGTNFFILADALEKKYPLICKKVDTFDDVIPIISSGGLAVANVRGGPNGLFSDSGHYVVVAALHIDKLAVLDPFLYNGKFDKPWRKNKVEVIGNVAYVRPADLAADTKRFWICSKKEIAQMNNPTVADSFVNVCGTCVPSKVIGQQNYVNVREFTAALNSALAMRTLRVSWTEETGAEVSLM